MNEKQGGLDRTNNVFGCPDLSQIIKKQLAGKTRKNYLLKFIIRGQKKRLFSVFALRFQVWERLLGFALEKFKNKIGISRIAQLRARPPLSKDED